MTGQGKKIWRGWMARLGGAGSLPGCAATWLVFGADARRPDDRKLPMERTIGEKLARTVNDPKVVLFLPRIPLASRKRVVRQSLPDVLAVAGTSVLAFRKPDTVGDHSFQDIRMDCSKGRENPSLWKDVGRGLSACRTASILSKTAGACDEMQISSMA